MQVYNEHCFHEDMPLFLLQEGPKMAYDADLIVNDGAGYPVDRLS